MRFLATAVGLLSLCTGTWALHESDVGVVDWHKHLVGVPLSGSISTAPSFHLADNRTIILTATGNNVLAALEPEDGSVLWRYIFDPEDSIAGYYKGAKSVATLSGPGGATLRNFDVLTGELLLERRLHKPELGALATPIYLGKNVIFSPDSKNLYVLTNGCTVTSIDADTGETKWKWTSPDQGSLVINSRLIQTADALYAVGVAKSTASFTVHVTSLSPSTGEVVQSSHIPSSITDPLNQFIVLTRPDLSKPVALWLEQGTVRYVGLTPTLKEKAKPIKGIGYAHIVDVGLNDHGHAVVVRTDGSSFVLKLVGEIGLASSAWEFEDSISSTAHADSTFAGSLDAHGRPYVARVFWSHKLEKGSADVFAGHLVSGQGLASGFVFPFDTNTHGIIGHVALDAENPAESTIKPRLLVTTSTGAIQLWEQSELKWIREEALAAIVIAEFVEIPERRASESGVDEAAETFVSRVTRQIMDAQDFPQYLVNFINRFVTGSYASPTASAAPATTNSSEPISRDTFGFRQIIVAATVFGKIYGIDSSNGEIVWSRVLGLGWAGQVGGRVQPVKLYVTKTVSDGGNPEVVLVAQRRADNTLVDTVVFHLDALTGSDVRGQSKDGDILEGYDIIQGPLVEGFLLQDEKKIIVLLDEFLQVYLYPDNPQTQAIFASAGSKLFFPLRTTVEDRKRVMGYQFAVSQDQHKSLAHPTWSLALPVGEDIQTLVPQTRGPVASIGRVLGNRTTLYKYLNPRLFTVLTAAPTRATCGIYVVDSVKGTVLYHAEVKATLKGCQVKTTFVENWLVYHYYEGEVAGGTVGGTTGYRLVSIEFYEGQKVDEKHESSDLSSYSNETLSYSIYEQSYVFPYAITALATTSTKFGISTKDLIVATENHRVQDFPRRFLDPRRPTRKPTAEEQEEFLIQYDPVLPNDPRRVLSHNYDVANVQKIVTSPALLESTSLVFAFGLDMFLTRVAPSNTFDVLSENFNKVQLVFTVSGLLLAILITRPMVKRKGLREKWYQH
ncbi:hypothetical protein GALMADRAFT_94668 [Galerina marginata CBS 339.88]|uniref:ER membrane protein complex subunit 1 n=1 Tax=Galerina marginata (strain CBS 339.88) TaxID=685588 RepID=A0A067T703_GALM3|nr:hypothetical protein GALMADRAFT_94668 [Galerina marginata CBS 339.88]